MKEPEPMRRKTLTIAQACEAVGVSRRTIYNWMDAGKVVFVRTAGAPGASTRALWRAATEVIERRIDAEQARDDHKG